MNKKACRALADAFPGRWNREYCYWKLRSDPLYLAASLALLDMDDGEIPLLDIGCGLGLFARYLRQAGFKAPIRGVDYDERKIRAAQAISERADSEALEFGVGDVRDTLPSFLGHLSILDVLQYFTEPQQQALLQQVAASVAPNGCLVIRSGLAEPTWRFRVTRVADWFAHGCFWMKGRPVNYPDKDGTERLLRDAGLEGTFTPLWGKTPFNNYLGIFRRTVAGS
ncbi:MAG: methyltransferase domain-containing protein [Verrucomicrobiaceae bacterium]|nr:class I SAM-dependent methyltransferase [Verrucomicrobiales bacterium]NCF84168.1 methyltransferase domain-containing protein [Verrucomicrobiaceae bacterium]MDB2347341.1 class I SAM-dependent methyltransferase [Verrucomicrobiales bacterium]MDB4772475.1 class I SAM-dependent methyltransferase [Verrucomicrobiales bacterium]MDF1784583.1 class I SAM-dependent methyltransferase [Verrucomicrobiales bacterium]